MKPLATLSSGISLVVNVSNQAKEQVARDSGYYLFRIVRTKRMEPSGKGEENIRHSRCCTDMKHSPVLLH